MPDLDDLRQQMLAARAQRDVVLRAHTAEEEKLRALRREALTLERRNYARDPDIVEKRHELAKRVSETARRAEELRAAKQASLEELARITALLEPLTDPRSALGALDARFPILLFPVRLETRFVTRVIDNAQRRQLLVRVFPDDCLVDGFEPDLSDSEVANVRRYWCATWAAGGDEGLERSAWRELCTAHGPGRALYLIKQYVPLPTSDAIPARASASEVILAIAADAPLANAAEKNAIVTYWTDTWRAGSNTAASVAAYDTMRAAVGDARAEEVRKNLAPFNAKDRPQAGVNRAAVNVSVVFVVVPPAATAATKRQAWTRAPEAALLPERFLLIADSGPEHVEHLGGMITQPLHVGPDPLAAAGEQFRTVNGDIVPPDQLKWMTDFDAALKAGMAFQIDLTPRQAEIGFDRLAVLGVRFKTDEEQSRRDLEDLIRHQAKSQSGFAIVAQGTPTNNSEEGSSGWARVQEADELFEISRAAQTGATQFDAAATAPYDKRDGLALAEALGIDAAVLQDIANADGTDQAEARAMNAALWPATLGYWMDTQMSPVFDTPAIARTRRHFVDRVSGRGMVPAVRIGKQPYGILPTSAFSRISWMNIPVVAGPTEDRGGAQRKFLRTLRDVLSALGRLYWDKMALGVPRVGKPSDTPQQQLLDVLGLHPSSVEFHLDVVDSAEKIWNAHRFHVGAGGRMPLKKLMESEMSAGIALLSSLGYDGSAPEIIEKFFAYVHGPMTRPVIDVPPLSETDELSVCTDDNKNYIEWCRAKAGSAFDDLRTETGFSVGKTPNALLYHMLRHALQLGYYGAALDLHETNGLLTPAGRKAAYHEPSFVHVAAPKTGLESESRYRFLYAREKSITGVAGKTVAEFIPQWMAAAGSSSVLADQLDALSALEHADTASLERAFAEHIDLCSYRWDAWMLSLVNERLHQMRRPNGDAAPRRQGIYLGAFGWLEELRPDVAAVPFIPPEDVRNELSRPGDAPMQRDPANGGHVLAPSLNHAVTAAVLRSGYLANAAPATPDVFAVDISSSRVRVALQFLEGVRNGQSLGALLGYQFERRLHDRHAQAEMDALIYQVRKAFPLASKHLSDSVTPAADDAPIEAVEARNVCDGTLLLEHVRTNPIKTYPWGKNLAPATAAQQTIIDEEVRALFEVQDAIADVAIAESLHQVTAGNVERAAAAMDAFSHGSFPPEPDVIVTPRSGISMTHRVALHLAVDAVAPAAATPRAKVEPAIDDWLGSVLPPLNQIVVRVTATNMPPGSAAADIDVDLASLGLRPIDLLHLLDAANDQAMNELDDRIINYVLTTQGLCPDASVAIRYTMPIPGRKTVFEVAPLAGSLSALLLNARPLKPTDAALQNEADPAVDTTVIVPVAQINAARGSVVQLRTDTIALKGVLTPLSAPGAAIAAVVAGLDAAIASYVAVQLQAALCGIGLSGAGSVLKSRRVWFALIRTKADTVLKRWQTKLTECDARIADGTNPANSDMMRVQALERAEREISTAYTSPIPNTPAPLLGIVTIKRTAFTTAQAQVRAVKESAATSINALWTTWTATFAPRPALDLAKDDSTEEEGQLRNIVGDMMQQLDGMLVEVEKRIAKGDKLVADAVTAAGEKKASLLIDAAKAFLGDGVRIVPRFTLTNEQGVEWQNAFDARASLIAHLATDHEFPVDDWIHGLARVRPKLHDLENVILLTGAFGTSEPALAPVQFPFRPAEPWLAMELPPGFDLTTAGDHLLYTASYPNGVFDKTAASFGGLLLDEWTEVVPGTQETAGLAFNYDRPSHEPPQAMLLVTPATAGEKWTWEDLAATIPETFELAKKRAVEPRDIAKLPLARFLPATLMAFTTQAISISSALRAADVAFAKETTHA